MAEQDLPRRVAFGFLNELLKRFNTSYPASEVMDAEPYQMASFNSTIGRLMKQFTENPPEDPVKQAQAEIARWVIQLGRVRVAALQRIKLKG